MNTYTLQDLNTIWTCKGYLPEDRFVHYFTLRFGYTEKEATSAYKQFQSFPKNVYGTEEDQLKIDKIIPLAIQLVHDLQIGWSQNAFMQNIEFNEKEIRKLIYKKEDIFKEVVLNLYDANDIITYADLLKNGIQTVALLRKCCDVNITNSQKSVEIFEGDIFDTNDNWYGINSNVYVAEGKASFRKLVYIKGKGYVRNGQLNYDDNDSAYSSYALKEWTKIGNVTTDLVKLTDDGFGDKTPTKKQ